MKECDEETKKLANNIKGKVEEIMETKLAIYEPIGYIHKLDEKQNKEEYFLKVHKGEQKYLHISTSSEIKSPQNMKVFVVLGKSLFDPL